ncbi:hypothetical protein HMPREF1487_09451 [Pseudomonas sp. HPB0071]|uniref:Uncharacterized protein n=2 Tax=Pseudomonas TaxID=286 RepID=A0A2X2CIG0_PSELU|nr:MULTISPECIES: hypothetical protein [Pseudomonas]ENA26972.1 hypothetical protein HMPREF1487_09451 [Pseudomonas sp. HPB0071]MBA1250199.1 hypothetical protein [Pseudomonas zeshuii]MBH3440950.1 hypothetical protein [Pseudomonas luteola]SPY99945.1 Uncharacterised protein [Pseudomonas luteola]
MTRERNESMHLVEAMERLNRMQSAIASNDLSGSTITSQDAKDVLTNILATAADAEFDPSAAKEAIRNFARMSR